MGEHKSIGKFRFSKTKKLTETNPVSFLNPFIAVDSLWLHNAEPFRFRLAVDKSGQASDRQA